MNRILIVDDHADIRRLVRMTLEFERYEVHEAADGVEALAKVRELRPDVVLLDVMMPGELDGLQVCAAIRADAALAATYVMLLSARGQARDRDEGMRAGADVYMVKPFSPLQLIEHIAQALSATA